MNLQPFNFKGAEVRGLLDEDGNPLVIVSDVCRVLDIANPSDVRRRLDEDEFTLVSIEGASNGLPVLAVNESGLYSLILGSRKPEAKAFKKWVTSEVLPAIRKTGSYSVPAKLPTLEETLETALRLVRENKALEDRNAELAPKAAYFDTVAASGDSHLVREAAKLLKNGWGEKKLFQWLRDRSYLMKNNEPYQEYVNRGYFTFTESSHTSPRSGKVYLSVTPRITGKGMTYLHSILCPSEALPAPKPAPRLA